MRDRSYVEYRNGLQDEWQALNRTHLGQIVSVDAENGRAVVHLATMRREHTLQVPMAGLSLQGLSSSWMR